MTRRTWSAAWNDEVLQLTLELIAVAFMGLIAFAAHASGIAVILFPELAALSYDVLLRPDGKWASQPLQIIAVPTITAVFGLFCTRNLKYGALNLALIVLFSLLVIRLLRSTIAPALSAGALPMVLAEHSWLYPLTIFLGLSLLVCMLHLRKRYLPRRTTVSPGVARRSQTVNALESSPPDRFWFVALMAFVLIVGAAAQSTGLRFLLFPPLIVMGYELFGHPEVPNWMRHPVLLPFVCLLTAAFGLAADRWIHTSSLAVMLTVLLSIGVLRLFRLHMPPALAIGLLPFLMKSPDYRYALSVFLGTISLTLAYLGYRQMRFAYRRHRSS